jgi:Glu-tRNA(Gln) amidotransferase subunit E-like FAD-binding protein
VSIKNLIIESKKFQFDDWKNFNGQIPDIKKIFESKPLHDLPYSLSSELIESLENCNFLDDVVQHIGIKYSKMVGNLIINEFKNKRKLSEEIFKDDDKRREFISNISKSDAEDISDVVEIETEDELVEWCLESIKSHDRALSEFKSGKDSAINAFKGDIMKKSKGKYSPKLIDETLREQIKKL